MQRAPITRCAATATGPGVTFFLIARAFRFALAVPLTALVLHFAQPGLPWRAWLGVAGLTLLSIWSVDGISAFLRRKRPRARVEYSTRNTEV